MYKLIIFALFMLAMAGICNGQGKSPFGATRAQDTSYTVAQVKFTAYGGSLDTMLLTIMPNGDVKKVAKNQFGATYLAGYGLGLTGNVFFVDTAAIVTQYDLSSKINWSDTVSTIYTNYDRSNTISHRFGMVNGISYSGDLAVNGYLIDGTFYGSRLSGGNGRIWLRGGSWYHLQATVRANFTDATGFATFGFYDLTNGSEIFNAYANGVGHRNIVLPPSFATNNSSMYDLGAMIYCPINTVVSVRLNTKGGALSSVVNQYSQITAEAVKVGVSAYPTGIDSVSYVDVASGAATSYHSQGMQFGDGRLFVSYDTRVTKVNPTTGATISTLVLADHIGGITIHGNKLYAVYTNIDSFNLTPTFTTIYRIDTSTMTVEASNRFQTPYASGAIGSDGTNMYLAYGSTALTTGSLAKVNPATLALTGETVSLPASFNEFGNGIQSLNYRDGRWYIGVHFATSSGGDLGYNGGGLLIYNTSWTRLQAIGNEGGNFWRDGYGNGFDIYNGNPVYIKVAKSGSNYTHRIVYGLWDMGGDNGK